MNDVEIIDSLLIVVEEFIMWNKESSGKVTLTTNLKTERDFDVLDLLELIGELEEKFNIEIPNTLIDPFDTKEEENTIENLFFILKTAINNQE